MIKLLGRWYWFFYKGLLPGPKGSIPPILIILDEHYDEENRKQFHYLSFPR